MVALVMMTLTVVLTVEPKILPYVTNWLENVDVTTEIISAFGVTQRTIYLLFTFQILTEF